MHVVHHNKHHRKIKMLSCLIIAGVLGACGQAYEIQGNSGLPNLVPGMKLHLQQTQIRRGDLVVYQLQSEGRKYIHRVLGMPGDRFRIRDLDGCKELHVGCNIDQFGSTLHLAHVDFKLAGGDVWQSLQPRKPATLLPEVHQALKSWNTAEGTRQAQVLTEHVGDHQYFIMETYPQFPALGLCSTIASSGCQVPAESYVVLADNRDNGQDSRYSGFVHKERILGTPKLNKDN